MGGKFKFSALGSNLVLFVGSRIKIKIPSEIKQGLHTYVSWSFFFKFKNSKTQKLKKFRNSFILSWNRLVVEYQIIQKLKIFWNSFIGLLWSTKFQCINIEVGNKVSLRGCLIIIWTGLNIKITIIQKAYEWTSCPFAKMIPRLEHHFGKIPAWSLTNKISLNCSPNCWPRHRQNLWHWRQ